MSEYTHTAAPWAVIKSLNPASKRLSVVSPAGDAELGNWMVADHVIWPEDAHLIAAAPELLEALKTATFHALNRGWAISQGHELREVYEQMKDAIAKAEGK